MTEPAALPNDVAPLERRTWCYTQHPKVYEVAGCDCGNQETQWSEFKKHLWCDKCQKDFIPAHNGIFDGPIAARTAQLMGICFDRIDLATQEIERFNVDTCKWEPPVKPPISPAASTEIA